MRRFPAAVTIAACALVLAVAPATAHPGHGGAQVVVDGITPAVKGVEVADVPGSVGKLRLTTSGATRVVVLGTGGQPMLRIGPGGVDANAASPDWYAVNEPLGIAQAPPSAKPSAPERWKRVSTQRVWEWFDHRFHPASGKPVYKWSVPLRVDGVKARIHGRLTQLGGLFALNPDTAELPVGVTVNGIGSPLPALQVTSTVRRVRVLGPDGEAFARIGPNGAEVNVRSSLWMPTAQARNQSLLDSVIDPKAKPKWVYVNRSADLIWPDPRTLPENRDPSSGLGEVARWRVPLVVGGRRIALTGTTTLGAEKVEAPPATPTPQATAATAEQSGGGSATALVISAVAAVVLAGALALFLLRRRRA